MVQEAQWGGSYLVWHQAVDDQSPCSHVLSKAREATEPCTMLGA